MDPSHSFAARPTMSFKMNHAKAAIAQLRSSLGNPTLFVVAAEEASPGRGEDHDDDDDDDDDDADDDADDDDCIGEGAESNVRVQYRRPASLVFRRFRAAFSSSKLETLDIEASTDMAITFHPAFTPIISA